MPVTSPPTINHPWAVLPSLVECDPPILTPDEAKSIVLAHQEANRRALMEVHALLPELMAKGDLTPEGAERITRAITKQARDGMPDL